VRRITTPAAMSDDIEGEFMEINNDNKYII
jgi:hypothetical protein